jgi:hypothetical protein
MDKETKSNIKIGVIALVVISAVMFGLYKYQQSHNKGHSHGNGEHHTH